MGNDMKTDKLRQLIQEVISQFDVTSEESERIFEILVSTTLAYRDVLRAESGTTLTVGETREALNILLEYISSHDLIQTPDEKINHLVRLWVHELNLDVPSNAEETRVLH